MDGIIVPRGGNVTSEKISWQSTLFGGLAFVGAQIALRICVLAVLTAWVLVFGRLSGPLVAGIGLSKFFNISIQFRPFRVSVTKFVLKRRKRTHALVFLGVGLLLTAAYIFNLWPALWWEIGDGRLWVATMNSSRSFGPLWLWLRVLFIAGMPFVLTRPFVNLDWMLDIETRWPKVRETGCAPADIESPAFRDPRRKLLHAARGGSHTIITDSIQSQEANPPDLSIPMKVDGV